MQISKLIAAGNMAEALAKLKQSIRSSPADSSLRTLLFQIYVITGDWEGASTQLNLLSDLDPGNEMFVQVYRRVLQCEVMRLAVFEGRANPVIFGEPEEWVGFLVQATQLLGKGEIAAAAELQSKAFELAPAIPGKLDGNRFEWFADADSALGPVLEAYVEGKYWWVPLSRIKEISSEGPKFVLDSVWLPVQFVWSNGGIAAGFIPVRYVGSERSADPALQLARKTEWNEIAPNFFRGKGQRSFASDSADVPVLDVRKLEFEWPI